MACYKSEALVPVTVPVVTLPVRRRGVATGTVLVAWQCQWLAYAGAALRLGRRPDTGSGGPGHCRHWQWPA